MSATSLPEEGALQLGPVRLPAGKQIHAGCGSGRPIAWATLEEVPGAGRVWAAQSRAHSQTGLMPFLLSGLDGSTQRPWDEEEFDDPVDIAGLDHIDAADLLREWWDDQTHESGVAEEDEDEGTREHIEFKIRPFSRRFPGLAPAEQHKISPAQLDDVLGSLPAARIGLVPADRPADVLPLIGWNGAVNGFATPLPIAAVLRSWEDRFGARLLEVGFDVIRLLADRPPRTVEHAQRVAAEHLVVSDQCAVFDITASLMETPIWEFWWD
jgi:Domain of unknown function (DUF4253)